MFPVRIDSRLRQEFDRFSLYQPLVMVVNDEISDTASYVPKTNILQIRFAVIIR